jgi:hypothetical protein
MIASKPQLLLLGGDFSYADDWYGPEEPIDWTQYWTFTCEYFSRQLCRLHVARTALCVPRVVAYSTAGMALKSPSTGHSTGPSLVSQPPRCCR